MKNRLFKIICALFVLPLLAGCWQAEPEEPDTSDLMTEEEPVQSIQPDIILPTVFRLPYAPDQTLDPITCSDGMQQVIGSRLYEGLFQLDHQLEPQPLLCDQYTYDAETLTYVFRIRSGVTFTDGSPLTAQDAAQTLKRAMASARYGARLAGVTAISAGEGSVTVTLSSPNTAFPALLDIPIVKAGTENQLVPVGTGPYVFLVEEDAISLQRNTSWWQGSRLPVDTIGLMAASDRDTMLYQFTSRDVQLITTDLTGTAPISVTGSISFQDADTTILQYVGFNTTRAPFDKPELRTALSLGINRGSVVSARLSGHGTATQFPVSPVSPLYPQSLEATYSYDAYAAAMTQAGWNDGEARTVTLLVNSENSFKVSAAEHVADNLSAFDLNVEVQALPWEDYTAALAAGQFDLYYGEVKLTADWDLSPLLGTGGTLNYGGWSSTQTDLLLSSLASSEDRAAAMELLCAHLRQQAPILPICFKSTSVLVQSGVVEGLTPTAANPFYRFSDCTVHLQEN